jgi:hypothetical protein
MKTLLQPWQFLLPILTGWIDSLDIEVSVYGFTM